MTEDEFMHRLHRYAFRKAMDEAPDIFGVDCIFKRKRVDDTKFAVMDVVYIKLEHSPWYHFVYRKNEDREWAYKWIDKPSDGDLVMIAMFFTEFENG